MRVLNCLGSGKIPPGDCPIEEGKGARDKKKGIKALRVEKSPTYPPFIKGGKEEGFLGGLDYAYGAVNCVRNSP
jgi:hypothetical protein